MRDATGMLDVAAAAAAAAAAFFSRSILSSSARALRYSEFNEASSCRSASTTACARTYA